MVLEDATADSTANFGDEPSIPSDYDRYSTNPASSDTGSFSSPSSTTIEINNVPRPLPIIGALFGYSQSTLGRTIQTRVTDFSRLVKRPLTVEEINGVAYHFARQQQIMSYGMPLATALGYWRALRTQDTYGFPLYKPNLEKFNPEKFGPLRGDLAKASWHGLRRFTWLCMGWAVGGIVFGSISTNVAATGCYMDTRMKDVVEAIKKYGEDMRNPATRKAATERLERAATGPPPQQGVQTVGGFGDAAQGQQDGQVPSPFSATEQVYPTAASASTASAPFDLDDASPTAGNGEQSMQSGPDTSAWDRLRRGQTPAPPSARGDRASEGRPGERNVWESRRRADAVQQEREAGSTLGDRFGFAGADADRQREKEQAQKEFDQRIERERRGENFDDDNRRWR